MLGFPERTDPENSHEIFRLWYPARRRGNGKIHPHRGTGNNRPYLRLGGDAAMGGVEGNQREHVGLGDGGDYALERQLLLDGGLEIGIGEIDHVGIGFGEVG